MRKGGSLSLRAVRFSPVVRRDARRTRVPDKRVPAFQFRDSRYILEIVKRILSKSR